VVTTASGSNAGNTSFTYAVPAPAVSSIAPGNGSTAGSYSVTIAGTNLGSATGVTIGGVACTALSSNTATSVSCTVPAGTGLNKAVVVTTAAGPSTGSVSFSYDAPTVSGINPSSGTTAGGTSVTISGSNLRSATGVTIGGSACTSASANSDTSVTCTTPAGSAGTASVVVTTASGSNAGNTSFTYAATINGECATIAATAFMPSANLCTKGTASTVTNTSPWTWTCTGSGTGHSDSSCSAPNQTTTTGTGVGRAVVAGTNNWVIDPASAGFTAAPSNPPAGYNFPHGLFGIRLITGTPNTSTTVTITYPTALPTGTVYWKYGSTASNPGAHWYQMPPDMAVISSDRLSIALTLTDNADGDDAYTTDSLIVDPGGPGAIADVPAGVASIPTLSEWGLIILSSLIAGCTFLVMRRKRI